MSTTELLAAARLVPFRPVRLHTSGGATLDVYHRDMIRVGVRMTAVGIPAASFPELWDRLIQIDNQHITHIEPLPAPATFGPNSSNGIS